MRPQSVTLPGPLTLCMALHTHACGQARARGPEPTRHASATAGHRPHAPACAQRDSCAHSQASQSASAAPGTRRLPPRASLLLACTLRDTNDSEGRGRGATGSISSPPGARPRLAFAASPSLRPAQALDHVEHGSDSNASIHSAFAIAVWSQRLREKENRKKQSPRTVAMHSFEVKACIRCRPGLGPEPQSMLGVWVEATIGA